MSLIIDRRHPPDWFNNAYLFITQSIAKHTPISRKRHLNTVIANYLLYLHHTQHIPQMKKYKIGIIGAGHIAQKMACTLAAMEETECYAIASRNQAKADNFASENGFRKAYGSYAELVNDTLVDMIYIATPHAMHYEQAMMCLQMGKPVLCEKAFTANAQQAEKLILFAHQQNVFITEAIWTRYMPLSATITQLVRNGIIGQPSLLTANLGYAMRHKERLTSLELAGGALLDVGVYTLNFATMVFGTDIESTNSVCQKTETGADAQNSITLRYSDNKMAILASSMYANTDRMGIISGDKGHLIVDNINNPQSVKIFDNKYCQVDEYKAPKQISGYEYEVKACIDAIEHGWIESPYMPHAETLRIMRQMDGLRKEWGIRYPFE